MTFDEQAATLNRQQIAELLASHQQLADSNQSLSSRLDEVTRQLEWFKQQLFGSKSERRLPETDARQLALGELQRPEVPDSEITIAEHRRRQRKHGDDETKDGGLRFDDSVPVEEIRIDPPAVRRGFKLRNRGQGPVFTYYVTRRRQTDRAEK